MPWLEIFLRSVMVMFSAQDMPSSRPCPLRSSVIRQSPCRTASRGDAISTRSPSTKISPAIFGSAPKIARAVSVRPLPTRPATPTISPLPTPKRHLGRLRVAPQALDPQRLARDHDVLAKGVLALDASPDHHVHDLGDCQAGERPGGDELAVAQHGHPVADLEDLLQAMRDIEDRHPFALSRLRISNSRSTSFEVRRRGRLVENEQLAFIAERLGDLDELHLRDAEAGDQRRRRHIESDFLQQRRRAPVRLAIIHQPVTLRQALEQEILRHRHLRQHGEFLMHDADAGAVGVGRGSRAIGLAVEDDLALVGRIDARRAD